LEVSVEACLVQLLAEAKVNQREDKSSIAFLSSTDIRVSQVSMRVSDIVERSKSFNDLIQHIRSKFGSLLVIFEQWKPLVQGATTIRHHHLCGVLTGFVGQHVGQPRKTALLQDLIDVLASLLFNHNLK
jgi:hypothetical protein